MEVITLGTGSPLPDPNRAGPATLVKADGVHLLVDAGRGVLMRCAAAGTGAPFVSAVLLTHLHSDHLTDLNDVITSRWVMSPTPNPLRIFGPTGTARVVEGILAMLALDVGYRLAHHEDLSWAPPVEVTEIDAGLVLDEGGVRVTAEQTDHSPVSPTLGYRIEHAGGVVAIAGDTVPCEGLDRLCESADVYVQTVLRPSLVEQVPLQRFKDTIDYHASIVQAAATAARTGVGTLVMTHLVPAPFPGTEHEWVEEAATAFDGTIVLAEDLTVIEVEAR
jgi:ribonuclease Z